MQILSQFRFTPWLVFLSVLLATNSQVGADVVTLNGGGAVHGNITASHAGSGANTVAVRTSSGGLVVFERDSVKNVVRGANAAGKQVGARASSAKPRLSPAQEAWMPKVRSLVARLLGSSRDQSSRARRDLLKIDNPDALPALGRYLGTLPNEDARGLYAAILQNMPGQAPVYDLVRMSLFDPSQRVRGEARKAIGADRADSARRLYIEVLKTAGPDLASLVAAALGEIGDPNGDSIPYLINHLSVHGARLEKVRPDYVYYGSALEGCECGDHVYSVVPLKAKAPSAGVQTTLSPVMSAATPSYRYHHPDLVAHDYENPAVLEALTKISGQTPPAFGFNSQKWQSWWANEKKNRDITKAPPQTRVADKTTAPR
jgi:hypothetical protein